MNKQPAVTAATRQRIVDAFWNLFARKQISQIRIREITMNAGLNRCTFYQYFDDIYEILHEEEDRIINEIIRNKISADAQTDFKNILSEIADMYQTNGKYITILTGENGDPHFTKLLKDRLLPEFRHRKKLCDSVGTDIIFEYGINGLLAACRTWYLNSAQLSVEDFLVTAEKITMHGIPAAFS